MVHLRIRATADAMAALQQSAMRESRYGPPTEVGSRCMSAAGNATC
jgi:hypothetical protein